MTVTHPLLDMPPIKRPLTDLEQVMLSELKCDLCRSEKITCTVVKHTWSREKAEGPAAETGYETQTIFACEPCGNRILNNRNN
jgi:hypothetical protein